MTSTLDKLLYRFRCASAETCRRSGEDDRAKKKLILYVQFFANERRCCCKLTAFLRCGQSARGQTPAPCGPSGRQHAFRTNTDDVAHVDPGVAPMPHRCAQVQPLGWWHLQRDCTPCTSACSSWTRRRPPPTTSMRAPAWRVTRRRRRTRRHTRCTSAC